MKSMESMTEQLAEEMITSVLNYRRAGAGDDHALVQQLEKDYPTAAIDFDFFLELMNTGALRATFVMEHGRYPPTNLDNDIVINTAFKMYWIDSKGEADYLRRFGPKKKWWQRKQA